MSPNLLYAKAVWLSNGYQAVADALHCYLLLALSELLRNVRVLAIFRVTNPPSLQ